MKRSTARSPWFRFALRVTCRVRCSSCTRRRKSAERAAAAPNRSTAGRKSLEPPLRYRRAAERRQVDAVQRAHARPASRPRTIRSARSSRTSASSPVPDPRLDATRRDRQAAEGRRGRGRVRRHRRASCDGASQGRGPRQPVPRAHPRDATRSRTWCAASRTRRHPRRAGRSIPSRDIEIDRHRARARRPAVRSSKRAESAEVGADGRRQERSARGALARSAARRSRTAKPARTLGWSKDEARRAPRACTCSPRSPRSTSRTSREDAPRRTIRCSSRVKATRRARSAECVAISRRARGADRATADEDERLFLEDMGMHRARPRTG